MKYSIEEVKAAVERALEPIATFAETGASVVADEILEKAGYDWEGFTEALNEELEELGSSLDDATEILASAFTDFIKSK